MMYQTASMQKRGLFIVFEGLDRCGKTSQCQKLVDYLKTDKGEESVQLRRFPERSTVIGKMIDGYLQGKENLNDSAIHLLFSANRWEAQKSLEDTLAAGTTVICDRYAYSGVAYSAAKGLDARWCKTCDSGLIQPDLVFFLHASKEVIKNRAGFGGERYENEVFQDQVRVQFEYLLSTEKNVELINAECTQQEVFQDILLKFTDFTHSRNGQEGHKHQQVNQLWAQ